MENNSTIVFSFDWRKEPPCMEECLVCNEVIYSDQYRLLFKSGAPVQFMKSDLLLCSDCYNRMNELNGKGG